MASLRLPSVKAALVSSLLWARACCKQSEHWLRCSCRAGARRGGGQLWDESQPQHTHTQTSYWVWSHPWVTTGRGVDQNPRKKREWYCKDKQARTVRAKKLEPKPRNAESLEFCGLLQAPSWLLTTKGEGMSWEQQHYHPQHSEAYCLINTWLWQGFLVKPLQLTKASVKHRPIRGREEWLSRAPASLSG